MRASIYFSTILSNVMLQKKYIYCSLYRMIKISFRQKNNSYNSPGFAVPTVFSGIARGVFFSVFVYLKFKPGIRRLIAFSLMSDGFFF